MGRAMKADIRAEKPGEIEFTVTLTMPLKNWIELRDSLSEKWPATDLRYAINQMVHQAQEKFWPDWEAKS